MEAREEKFRVRTYECERDGRIKVYSLMQQMQEIAAGHAEELGVGCERLNEAKGYWVLSNLMIEIERLPRWNEEFSLKTWPSSCTRATATREFAGRDASGDRLFAARSEWMVLNRISGRPKNIFRIGPWLPRNGENVLPNELVRLEPKGPYGEAEKIRVPYSAIDLNGHVNNTEYVRWGMDALRRRFNFDGELRRVHVSYLAEVFEGDAVDILVWSDAHGKSGVLGRKPHGQENAFLMELQWDR
jgi:medium-chain acyl-[acyl-carrier-protein] hydrolase